MRPHRRADQLAAAHHDLADAVRVGVEDADLGVRQRRPDLLPGDETGVRTLLEAWMIEKAMYEIGYELNNRPDWVGLPLSGGVRRILECRDFALERPDRKCFSWLGKLGMGLL